MHNAVNAPLSASTERYRRLCSSRKEHGWAGGAVSYSEHDESNLNFLVIKDLEGNGYNFAISPYVGYFFRDNISAGVRFAYRRNYLDLGNVDANLGDITISFKDLYYLD